MLYRQRKYFTAVVDCHSFTEAAEQCYISQSAISQQISALEQELEVKLLTKDGRKFRFTLQENISIREAKPSFEHRRSSLGNRAHRF